MTDITKQPAGMDMHEGFHLRPFALERYFARFEFNPEIRYLLCCSDGEPLTVDDLMSLERTDVGDELPVDPWSDLKNLSLGYTDSAGSEQLREKIASVHYETVSKSNIVVAAPQELVFLTLLALLQPGDSVVAIAPAYQSLHEVGRAVGAEVIPWEPKHESKNSVLKYDIDDLENLVNGKSIKLVVMNVPHNPTGWLPTHNEWTRIVEICNSSSYKGGAYLFSDEMYRFLEHNGASQRLTAAVDAMASGTRRGISLSGLSKCTGLPGLRIGWIATHESDLINRIKGLRDYTTICGSAPSELMAIQALDCWDALIERQLKIIKKNIAALDDFMCRWKSLISWEAPKSGTIAFPRWKIFDDDTQNQHEYNEFKCSEDVCLFLAQKHGILLLPGEVVGIGSLRGSLPICHPDNNWLQKRFRIGFGRVDMIDGLDALDRTLKEIFT